MRYMSMLIVVVVTAIVFLAADSAKAGIPAEPLMLGSGTVVASPFSSFPIAIGGGNLPPMALTPAQNSQDDTKNDKAKKDPQVDPPPFPPPRSTSCPPPPNDDPRDANCGKGNDSKLP